MYQVTQQVFRPCADGKGRLFVRSTTHLFHGTEWGQRRDGYFGKVVADNGLTEARERRTIEGLIVRSYIEKAYERPREELRQAA